MKHLYFLIILIFLLGCQKDEHCNSRLDKYPNLVTGYFYTAQHELFDFQLKYNSEGKIIKRVGGVTNITFPITSRFMSNNVYDSISYNSDTIIITNIFIKPYYGGTYNEIQKETKIILSENGNFARSFTDNGFSTEYFYNSNNQISKKIATVIYNSNVNWTWNYTYNYSENGNLTSYDLIFNDGFKDSNISTSHFSNFDNSPNSFKDLSLFEDTFLRSLSTNNFRKYNDMEWEFSYDDCGYIKFY